MLLSSAQSLDSAALRVIFWDTSQKLRGGFFTSIPSDIEIARGCRMLPIAEVAARADIDEKYLEQYGRYKAKIDLSAIGERRAGSSLVLVTAISPTPAGEGKTTNTIALADALRRLGQDAVVAMREPSQGPVFGIKGGACGGGYAQVVPMEDINLHFTGDIHAVGAANNLLAAMLDNHIQHGNALNIDLERITWRRCVDMNDRQLRFIRDGLGGDKNGVPRDDGFDITVASEVMAVLCLADSLHDLKQRLARIVVAYDTSGNPVTCGQLKAAGAMAALLKDAIKPNLVQTMEGTPAFVHGGPFANIAHGCSSVIATRLALSHADYVITEAGFGADLGAEKFFDIKCRQARLVPDAAVIVATVRALKMHGGVDKAELSREDIPALELGLSNLMRHLRVIRETFGLPCLVALNRFETDSPAEIALVMERCRELGVEAVLSDAWSMGGRGAKELGRHVMALCKSEKGAFRFAYEDDLSLEEKLRAVVQRVYGGADICLSEQARSELAALEALGFGRLPVCIAKTQYSFSDDASKLGAPEGFTVNIRNVKVASGAGFVIALAGNVLTMPGLPLSPAAERIDVDDNGLISGLF